MGQYTGRNHVSASLEPDRGDTASGAGDLVVAGQAAVWRSRREQLELDLGVELTLPTGSATLLAGSTAVRPFVSGVLGFLKWQF